MKDIIIVDDVSGNIDNMKNVVNIYNDENSIRENLDSLTINDLLSCPIASENRTVTGARTKWEIFHNTKVALRNLTSKALILIVDINLDIKPNSVIRNKILQEAQLENVRLPSYFHANGEDISKVGIAVLMAEVITNKKIEKALIFISSEVVTSSDERYLSEYFKSLIVDNNRCSNISCDFSNPYPMANVSKAKDIIKLALESFNKNFYLPIHYAIEQLLIAQDIGENFIHPKKSFTKTSENNNLIKENTLFHKMIYSGSIIDKFSCEGLFSDTVKIPVKIRVLQEIFTCFNYNIVTDDNIAEILFPVSNSMIFIAHLLRFLDHFKKCREIKITIVDSTTKITMELNELESNDALRLENGLITYCGENITNATTIKHLRNLLSCNISIVNDYRDLYGSEFAKPISEVIQSAYEKISPRPMKQSSQVDSSTKIFQKIIGCDFFQKTLTLSWTIGNTNLI